MIRRTARTLTAQDWFSLGLVCALGTVVTFFVSALFARAEQRATQFAFKLEVDERFSRVQRRFTVQDLKLDTVKRFFVNGDNITEKEFKGFVGPLVEEGETYGWVQRIPERSLDGFKTQTLLNGNKDFSYYELDTVSGLKLPLTARSEHWILLYLVKRDDVKITPGLDVLSRPGRKELLTRARDSHKMVVSEPLRMTSGQSGIFFVAPVFEDVHSYRPEDDGLQGYVISTIRLAFLMEQNIPARSLQRLNVTLFTTGPQRESEEVYHSTVSAAPSYLYTERTLKIADQNYLLSFRPSQAFLQAHENLLPSQLARLGGLALTLVITTFAYSLLTQRARALLLVDARTRDLEHLNITDHLTGAYNRRYFEKFMEQQLIGSGVGNSNLSIIMLDIDHFKQVNDIYGHSCGDHVLKMLCEIVKHSIRKTDVFCRTGGEEFTLICPGSDLGDAIILAEKIKAIINGSVFDEIGTVTCSFGVAAWIPPESFDSLIRRVDKALYQAKANGRNLVQRADS